MDYFWFEKIFQAFYFCFNFLNLPNLSIRIDDVGLPKDSEQIRFILSSRLVLYPVGAIDGRHEPNWFGRQIRARTQADGVRLTTFQDYWEKTNFSFILMKLENSYKIVLGDLFFFF